jgi:hypothetical protein
MVVIDFLNKILSGDCEAEIRAKKAGLLLVVRPEVRLSSSMGSMIRNEGFRFKYCYSGLNGKPVIVFRKDAQMRKKLIEAKSKDKTIIEKPVEKVGETYNLVAAIKASLQKTKTKKKR